MSTSNIDVEPFKIGDVVQVVGYGATIFKCIPGTDMVNVIDVMPHLVGKVGIVDYVSYIQGEYSYALSGLEKHAWYSHKQLKLISRYDKE